MSQKRLAAEVATRKDQVMTLAIAFDNSYARLPARFFATARPDVAPAPRLLRLNAALAGELGLDPQALASPDGIAMLSGGPLPSGARPIALAYAGHQFGHFVPDLGDGRAALIGEVLDRQGRHRDLQLKGSGRTVFSRRGDGKAALGPVLREYIVSEAMAALGLPTTRTLAAVATGEAVQRDQPLPGAVLTRVALSHVRVGTFQYFAHRGDVDGLRLLADHVIDRLYPEVASAPNRYAALYAAVVERQAHLVAGWLGVGFIHGVMNTDNRAVSGETIDYGPCAFMDDYDPARVLSSIDHQGRYAYGNQPQIAQWNLARLAECLLPLIDADHDTAVRTAVETLSAFATSFEAAYFGGLGRKLGLADGNGADRPLVVAVLKALAAGKADFTLAFRRLADLADGTIDDDRWLALFARQDEARALLPEWRQRLAATGQAPAAIGRALRAINPILIPRNHQIEAVIAAAVEWDDFRPFHRLADALATPFDETPATADLALPPRPEERVTATFCGT